MSRTTRYALALILAFGGCGDSSSRGGPAADDGSSSGEGSTTAPSAGGSNASDGGTSGSDEMTDGREETSGLSGSSSGQGGEDCAPGWLDCDDEPGCESNADTVATCGSCDKSCEFAETSLACSDGVCSGTLTFAEVEEVSTREPGAGTNYNDQPILWVTGARLNNEHAYIRFSQVDELPKGVVVHEAVLILDRPAPLPSIQPIEFSIVSGDWDDDTLTWATEPTFEAPFTTAMVGEEDPLRVDVVAAVEAWVAGVPNHGVVLVSGLELEPLDSDNVTFYGSEVGQWGLEGTPPQLELTVSY